MQHTEVMRAIHTTRRLRVAEESTILHGRTVFATASDPDTGQVRVLLVNERGYTYGEAGVVMADHLTTLPEDDIVVPHTWSKLLRAYEIRCVCGNTVTVRNGEVSNHPRPWRSEYRADAVHGNTWVCIASGRAATLRAALEREAGLSPQEGRIRHILGGALEAEGAELPPFPWERRQRAENAA